MSFVLNNNTEIQLNGSQVILISYVICRLKDVRVQMSDSVKIRRSKICSTESV